MLGNTSCGDAGRYQIGQILIGKLDGVESKAIVLDKAEDSGELLLMTLAEGRAIEVRAAEVSDWTLSAPPEARWVEVFDGEYEEPFFAAYVPTLRDALALGRVFGEREGHFRVEILAANDVEQSQLGNLPD